MRQLRRTLALAVAGVLTLALAAPVVAAPVATTYHGVFTPVVDFRGCTTQAPAPEDFVAGGTWNVIIHGDKATVAVNIFVNGRHHVSFGTVASPAIASPGETFAVQIETGAGPLRVGLAEREFFYDITPYDFSPWGGLKCDGGVTYHGTMLQAR
jgi:hypothetical protein